MSAAPPFRAQSRCRDKCRPVPGSRYDFLRSPRRRSARHRKGNIVCLTAILMTALVGMVAFAVDVGYLSLVRTELQRSADASALAAAAALYPTDDTLELHTYYLEPEILAARRIASQYVEDNGAGKYRASEEEGPQLYVDVNNENLIDGDVVMGRLYVPTDASEPLKADAVHPNAVRVNIRMTNANSNGTNSLFFAPVLGTSTADSGAEATAVVEFPSLLPITTSESKWDSLQSGGDGDNYNYQPGNVSDDSDGIPEIQIFPDNNWSEEDGLPPGNFGALQIGEVQGVEILRRQIDMGPSPADIDFHGGSLYEGIHISGKTGVNGDLKTAFVGGNADNRAYAGILGKVRYLPIYNNVTGNGDNSLFTITKFVAVRVTYVKMTGNPKYIVIQPVQESENIFNVMLVR